MNSSNQAPPSISQVKDDDEFQEFQVKDWNESAEDHTDAALWQDSWDSDSLDDEFSLQLRAELEKEQKNSQK